MPRPQLFISYKSEDSHEVRAVVDTLLAHGLQVWFAEYEVLPDNYDRFVNCLNESLEAAVMNATHAVIFSNARWAASEHCRRELGWITQRFGATPERVLHIRLPRESLDRHLSDGESLQLDLFETCLFPSGEAGYLEAARAIVELVAPEAAFAGEPPPAATSTVEFMQDLHWGRFTLRGPLETATLSDMVAQETATSPQYCRTLIGNVAVEITADLRPSESLLSPWELTDRREGTMSSEAEEIDDRAVYGRLRRAAREWLETQRLEARGLHLFWHRQADPDPLGQRPFSSLLGKMAMTCVSRSSGETPRWLRQYLLVVIDPISGAIGQVSLSVAMPWQGDDPEAEWRRFLVIAPVCDRIAESVRYLGSSRVSVADLAIVFLINLGLSSLAAYFFLPHWSLVAKSVPCLLVSVFAARQSAANVRPKLPNLDDIPPRPREFTSTKYGYTLQIPLGWKVATSWFSRIWQYLGDMDVQLTPIGQPFPSLAVNCARDPAFRKGLETSIARSFIEHAARNITSSGGTLISRGELQIGAATAFEFAYTLPSQLVGPTGFYKLACCVDGRLFFVQGSCVNLERDLPLMRRIMMSLSVTTAS